MKLSPTQQKVIQLMKEEGYELGFFGSRFPWCHMQQGGIGKRGKSHRIRVDTFRVLRDKGLITLSEYRGYWEIYVLKK